MKSKLSFAVQALTIVNFVSMKTRFRDNKIAFSVIEYLGILTKVDFTFVQSDFVPVLYAEHDAQNISLIKQPSTYFKLEIKLYLVQISNN